MSQRASAIEALVEAVPEDLLLRSGKVFYSGRAAFASHAKLYMLGVNPGGDPANHVHDTVKTSIETVVGILPDDWSAYRDESWEGNPAGTFGMAPRILHMFSSLGLQPGKVPCSNLVFVRSRREGDLIGEMATLADRCWPFHERVIALLGVQVVLCLGRTAGKYVCCKLSANKIAGEFVETNNRRWRSQCFQNDAGRKVIVVTHPSIADWTCPSSDPTPLIRDTLT